MMHPLDLAVIAVYLAGVTVLGLALRRRHASLQDYFLADGRLPWWAISFSIVAAETSVLTIISVPGLSFAGDFGFLQLVFGFLVARIVISLILIPAFFRRRIATAYELLRQRFGQRLQALSALIFLVGRSLAEGVRFLAIAVVADVILDALPPYWHARLGVGGLLAVIALLTLCYTFAGGLRAVVWTDFVQMCLYIGGALLGLHLLLAAIPGGWAQVAAVAAAHGDKLRVFHFAFSWTETYTFWSGLIGGTFLTMATHGTDQLMVQRLLAARSERESQLALLSSWVVLFLQFVLFLAIGVALFAYHHGQPPPAGAAFGRYDRLYPQFIAAHFPVGLAGLALAAIISAAMSNLSAALNSLASSTIFDFYLARRPRAAGAANTVWLSRLATIFWMAVLAAVAFGARHSRSVLETGLTIVSYPFSALLGVFLLGTLTRRARENGAIVGMICGLVVTVVLGRLGVAYTWFAVAGTLVTFAVGYVVSCFA